MFGGAAANDGMFRQQEVYQESSANPVIASDGSPLVDSLEVAFQSPGHMRVCRVKRDTTKQPGQPGYVEYQEQWRAPSAEEVQILKDQGVVKIGPGGVLLSGLGEPGPTSGQGIAPGVLVPSPGGHHLSPMNPGGSKIGKVIKYGAILGGVGLVGWLGYKYAWPWISDKIGGDGGREERE